MKYLEGKFTVAMSGDETYRANWDAIFAKSRDLGNRPTEPAPPLLPGDDCACESGSPFTECHGIDPSEE